MRPDYRECGFCDEESCVGCEVLCGKEEEDDSVKLVDQWVIDDDAKADWAVEKIKEHRDERDRLLDLVKRKRAELDEQEQKIRSDYDARTGWLTAKLNEYMGTVKCKQTKTQQIYQLVSGKLIRKSGGIKWTRDDAVLADWMVRNGYSSLVELSPKWGEFKKNLTADMANGFVTDANGQFVEGLSVEQNPDVFEVK